MKFIKKIRCFFINAELNELELYLRALNSEFYSSTKMIVLFPYHSYHNDYAMIQARIKLLKNKLIQLGD